MNVFIYGNAQIDEDSLIGINEGTEKLTLTLLIGIKADLPQFILYPDRLTKMIKFLNYTRDWNIKVV